LPQTASQCLARLEVSSRSLLFLRLSLHDNRAAASIPAGELAEFATKNPRAGAEFRLKEVATVESPRSPRPRTVEELTRNIRQGYLKGSIKSIPLGYNSNGTPT
jgi:hypothetical protein